MKRVCYRQRKQYTHFSRVTQGGAYSVVTGGGAAPSIKCGQSNIVFSYTPATQAYLFRDVVQGTVAIKLPLFLQKSS